LFFSSDVTLENGITLSEDELVHQLEQDLVSYVFGTCGEYPELLCLSLTAEVSKYEIAIRWMHRLLWSSKSTTAKLQNRIAIVKQSLPETLRDPSNALWEVHAQELYTDAYTGRASRARRLIEWIPGFERQLKREPGKVVAQLDQFRAQSKLRKHRFFLVIINIFSVLRPSGLLVSVMGDILKLDRPRSSWLDVFKGLEVSLSVFYALY
jgi:hypothetical protein